MSDTSTTIVLSRSPSWSSAASTRADLGVGVGEESGEDLHHPGVQPPVLGRRGRPSRRRAPRARAARCRAGTMPSVIWRSSVARSPRVPSVVELAAVGLDPLGGHVVRRVGSRRARATSGTVASAGRGGAGAPGRWPRRRGPRTGGSPRRACAADRRRSCRAPARAPSGWRRRPGTRSGARTPCRAASSRTAPTGSAGHAGSGATCRRANVA